MKIDSIIHRLSNSFAYRFNKFSESVNRTVLINLDNTYFKIPLSKNLGEYNLHLDAGWFLKLLKCLKIQKDTDVIDIGANEGQTLLSFRSCYNNTYWAFEPNPVCVSYLKSLVEVNNLNNVHIIPTGLSSENKLVSFFKQHSHDTGATIINDLRLNHYKSEQKDYVPVFCFDELPLTFRNISFIKIDVEGAELFVIKGMMETLKTHAPIILCEILDYDSEESKESAQSRATELFSILQKLNYQVYRVVHNNDQLSFEPLSEIKLKKFVESSYDLNDYLFLPQFTSLPDVV